MKFSVAAVCCLVLIGSGGCYHYRVAPPKTAPATEPMHETVWSLVWGLSQEEVQPPNCPPGTGVAEATVSSNFAFALLTIVSLGFAAPASVEWRCGKDQGIHDHL